MFSKACEYGIRASICIAKKSSFDKSKISLKDVAIFIDSPEAYTSKILQKLVRYGLINSDKGPNGGFSMDKLKLDFVTLSMVVTAIDGNDIYTVCGLGLRECNEEKPCPVHSEFKVIRAKLKNMLEQTTIHSLAKSLEDGETYLKI